MLFKGTLHDLQAVGTNLRLPQFPASGRVRLCRHLLHVVVGGRNSKGSQRKQRQGGMVGETGAQPTLNRCCKVLRCLPASLIVSTSKSTCNRAATTTLHTYSQHLQLDPETWFNDTWFVAAHAARTVSTGMPMRSMSLARVANPSFLHEYVTRRVVGSCEKLVRNCRELTAVVGSCGRGLHGEGVHKPCAAAVHGHTCTRSSVLLG
jgi:hypothetical protein